ncbi:hypothetical protein VHUM_00007 [Vanrija humicola]|uniref:Ras modification protein ERF4 n=1 Tax=Vanrija humicola TaxID=5417 RepID=A0A7D8Z729_VANHU|nr:hypothetical protein VHUM_00007 [Vanrija humicola]
MASPPANHPFLRPAITATTAPPGSFHPPDNTAFYQPMGTSIPSSARTSLRPASQVSAAPSATPSAPAALSSPAPPVPSLPRSPRPETTRSVSTGPPVPAASAPVPSNGLAAPEPPRKLSRWEEKVQGDLAGWRGGVGEPRSSVPHAAASTNTYYGQPPTGTIGRDLPKEIVRVERDYSLGDICQFTTNFPIEIDGRVTPTEFAKFVEAVNEPLREAYSVSGAVVDNVIAVLTWWTSLWWRTSHFEKELQRAEAVIRKANETTFNPAGLNVLSPREVALQYVSGAWRAEVRC